MKKYVFAITGATGSLVGIKVLKELLSRSEVHLIISAQSFSIIRAEAGLDWHSKTDSGIQKRIRKYFKSNRLFYHNENNMAAPVSSGSFKTEGMFVVPCSMKTLSGIANGYAENLIQRAADVTIKEGRILLVSPRETPLNAIHLENMLKLARLGVRIVPPVIGFYNEPESIDDIINFIAGKILDSIGFDHALYKRWKTDR